MQNLENFNFCWVTILMHAEMCMHLCCAQLLYRDALTFVYVQTAGNAVKKAAQSLVNSAKEAAAFQEPENEEFPVSSGGGLVGTIRDEMEAMEKILAKEKELKEAQAKLKRLREKKYQQGPKPTPPPGKSEAKRRMEWPPKQ